MLRCTFLSVGHGCAVVVETPSGRTLLFDAGSFADGSRATRIIASALWSRGCRGLDAVVLSHPDVDHYNGLPGLLERMPIGVVMSAQSFLDFAQRPVEDACEAAARAGVPWRIIQAGDDLKFDPEVGCEVLHPAGTFASAEDNANSVVLRLTYAGRSLLLTGDLEGAGLQELLRQEARPVDIMLAPHQGSVAANDRRLAAWAARVYVVLSTGDAESLDRVRSRYDASSTLLSTAQSGAVMFTITPSGDIAADVMIGEKPAGKR